MNDDQPPSPGVKKNWIIEKYLKFRGIPKNREQLLQQLRAAEKSNLIDRRSLTMLEGVFHVSDMQARDVMLPRAQMAVIEDDGDLKTILNIIVKSGHSRFPVIDKEHDKVVGILLAKDVLKHLARGDKDTLDIDDMMRAAIFIPESKRLSVLLKEFRDSRNHMAIVVDEYANIAGLVTIEDVLEQIVGDIDDEHDQGEVTNSILQQKSGSYTIKALTPIDEFNAYFHSKFPEKGADTIGGFIIHQFGHLPQIDETVDIGNYHFRIVKADSRRIRLLEMTTIT